MTTSARSARYFEWLVGQVEADPELYRSLFQRLHWKEFQWFVPNDDNRIGDAVELRREFWGEGVFIPENPVSVLEIIVGLSRRCAWQDDGTAEGWAWQLIKNLKLHRMTDPITTKRERQIDEILDALIFRTYDKNGSGGFFPLKYPDRDQTKVEIWYQMSAYIIERS